MIVMTNLVTFLSFRLGKIQRVCHFYKSIISLINKNHCFKDIPSIMHPNWPKMNLSENPLKETKQSVNEIAQIVAYQMGERAQHIFTDLKKYKQNRGDLAHYDFSILNYRAEATQSNICAKILNKKMKAFKCHNCIYENNSIMCVECFEQSDHQGHIYEVVEVHGGCCDCGDEEKWDPKGFCKYHSNKDLVDEMKRRVDRNKLESFIKDLKFYFTYWFILYNDAELFLKQGHLQSSNGYIQKMKEMSSFGVLLLEYLSNFNKNSLISNIMTFNLLTSKLELKEFELIFCPNANQKPIFQIMFHMVKLGQCSQLAVNLFTHLFTLREFRRILTIAFICYHHDNPEFAMSSFNHLSCQLLTSHKMITELALSKQIPPLVYKPKKQQVRSFEELAHNFVRYYIDIEYLSSLYKDSSQTYLNYHILEGQFPSLGYYKNFSCDLEEETINYYGIEQIRLNKIIKILKVVQNSKSCLPVLQKGIQDLWEAFQKLYKTQNFDLFNDHTFENACIRNIYLTYQNTLAMTVFVYFELLQEANDSNMNEDKKIDKLISILGLDKDQSSIAKVTETIQVLNSNLILSGLTLGHPQTMERFYTFFSFTFKKSFAILSSTMYMYKILVKILNQLRKMFKLETQNNISDNFVFERSLKILQLMLFQKDSFQDKIRQDKRDKISNSFQDNDEQIFDRKKNIIRLTFFMHLITQTCQTDVYQLILASYFNFQSKQKYEKRLMKFYIEILKNYDKISLKQFKKIADSLIYSDTTFQKFLSSSKQISIQHGKIGLKNQTPSKSQQLNLPEGTNKIQSELNPFYFKSFKSQLTNINEKQTVFKVPSSSNHFLHQVLSDRFVSRILDITQGYMNQIVIKGGKILERQSATLGLLVIQIIKVQKALKFKPSHQMHNKISDFLKKLKQNKTFLSIFTEDVIKIICSQSEQKEDEVNQSLQRINKEAELKSEQRRRKLQQKKSKMIAKYKQTHEKYQNSYAIQLQKIRQEMTEQAELNTESLVQVSKTCIVCKQNGDKEDVISGLMLMAFMQLSDMYEHFLGGKHEEDKNCHLVFKTCGHYIHQTCYSKINKQKDYTLCHLCRSPVNCLFPVGMTHEQLAEMAQKEVEIMEKKFYQDLSNNYSMLFARDDSLRQDCENGFKQSINDDRQFKQKLIESLVIETIFSSIINQDANGKFFKKRQLEIYQNILKGLQLFCKGERNEFNNSMNHSQKLLIKAQQEKNKINSIIRQRQLFRSKVDLQKNKQKKRTMQIVYSMEHYLRRILINYIENQNQKQSYAQQHYKLSQECVEIIEKTFNQLTGQTSTEKREGKSDENNTEIKETDYKNCPQISLLRQQIQFYVPPTQLQKLIEMRGKCPNCQLYTNHLFVCVICKWKGCKGCKEESVFQHTSKKHAGNSMYIEANLGNIYLVSKKRYWVYPSLYKDYLGQSFKSYVNGMKLEKYLLNEHSWTNFIKKTILDYDIETRIRYEEYNMKRSYIGIL